MLIKQSTKDYYKEHYGRPMASYLTRAIEFVLENAKQYDNLDDAIRDAKAAWNDGKNELDPEILIASDDYSDGGKYYVITNGNWEHLIRLAGFEQYEEWWNTL